MFTGTSYYFRILYFLTTMLPAYIVFVLQLKIDELVCVGLILLICILEYIMGVFIEKMIINREKSAVNKSESISIESKNGDILTFIFGVIVPSILLPDDSSNIKLLAIQVSIQLVIFIIMQKSSDIVPNVTLILQGISTYKTNNGEYIISNSTTMENGSLENMYRLGDSEKVKIFIV